MFVSQHKAGARKPHPFIKFLMKLGENKINFDIKDGAIFRELFDHPDYLRLKKNDQTQLGLQWARNSYQIEKEHPVFDIYFGDIPHLVERSQNGVLLDIGCYIGGKTVRRFERYKGAEIHGVDIDPKFIDIASQFASERDANALFKVNFAEELDFPDATFDVILSENTFEHVRDLSRVMQECRRVLKKDGLLTVIFPSFLGPYNHHLDLVTRTPFIHWFFKYPDLLDTYLSILDERGDNAFWYRRREEHPLSYERGYTINGTSAVGFHKLAKQDWRIIADGFNQKIPGRGILKSTIMKTLQATHISFFREFFPIAYILQKR